MIICEFCNSYFSPRPQIKNPRACSKKCCQEARQKANEKDWHERNKGLYDGKYHRIKRSFRKKKLKEIINNMLECLKIGSCLKKIEYNFLALEDILSKLFLDLGIKAANKWCTH